MASREPDPYATLGLTPGASDEELRAAYRHLVQLHHPDHNGGSAESARRFEAVQDAYGRVRQLRSGSPRRPHGSRTAKSSRPDQATRTAQPRPNAAADPAVESRIADLERELRVAQQAREEARRAARDQAGHAAREAASAARTGGGAADRPSDEALGYVSTDDSFTKILADARSELADRLSDLRERGSDDGDSVPANPVARRVGDLIAGLDELADRLREHPPR